MNMVVEYVFFRRTAVADRGGAKTRTKIKYSKKGTCNDQTKTHKNTLDQRVVRTFVPSRLHSEPVQSGTATAPQKLQLAAIATDKKLIIMNVIKELQATSYELTRLRYNVAAQGEALYDVTTNSDWTHAVLQNPTRTDCAVMLTYMSLRGTYTRDVK